MKALAQICPPVLAFLFVYLAALAALFVSAFWSVDPFTSEIVQTWSLDNFRTLWEPHVPHDRAADDRHRVGGHRHDVLLAFPFAYFLVRVASARAAGDHSSSWCSCRCGRATSYASIRGG